MSAFIAYRNRVDTATLAIPDGIPVAGYPASNVAIRQSSHETRINASSGVASISIDFGQPLLPRLIAAFGVSHGGLFSIQRSTNGSTWSGVSLDSVTNGDGSLVDVPQDIKALVSPATPPARYWRLYAVIPGGGVVVSIGRLWASSAADMVEFGEGVDATWSMDPHDPSEGDSTAGQIYYDDKRPVWRGISCRITARTTDETWGFAEGATAAGPIASMQDAQLTAGRTGEVVVAPRGSPLWLHRTCFRGRLPAGLRIAHMTGPLWTSEFSAVEER